MQHGSVPQLVPAAGVAEDTFWTVSIPDFLYCVFEAEQNELGLFLPCKLSYWYLMNIKLTVPLEEKIYYLLFSSAKVTNT